MDIERIEYNTRLVRLVLDNYVDLKSGKLISFERSEYKTTKKRLNVCPFELQAILIADIDIAIDRMDCDGGTWLRLCHDPESINYHKLQGTQRIISKYITGYTDYISQGVLKQIVEVLNNG